MSYFNIPSKHTIVLDTVGNNVVEQYSNAVRTIEQEHAMIHDGNAYQLSGRLASLASAASEYILIDPSTPVHWRYFKFQSEGGPFDVELFKNPTTTDPGSALTPVNRNDISSNTSSSTITEAPTVTDDGTRMDLDVSSLEGTGSRTRGALEGVGGAEWVIDGGNTYLIKVTNNDNSAILLTYKFFWYEL